MFLCIERSHSAPQSPADQPIAASRGFNLCSNLCNNNISNISNDSNNNIYNNSNIYNNNINVNIGNIPVPNFDEFNIDNQDDQLCSLVNTNDLKLPHIVRDNVPRITYNQLASLIEDISSYKYEKLIILDARFYYEYKGGHIISAKNITSKAQLYAIFDQCKGRNYCVICHCEFSQKRGPALFQLLRAMDRDRNTYPNLSIPEMYVLEGGYRQFFNNHANLCVGGYIEMRDEAFISSGELKRCNSLFREQIENGNSVRRAFGRISDMTDGHKLKRSNSTNNWDPRAFGLTTLPTMENPLSFPMSFLSFSASQEPSI